MMLPSLLGIARQVSLVLASILLTVVCNGALTWETQRVDVTSKPGDKEAVGLFHFRNSGDKTVTITSVRPSCGCTTAELAKRVYAPGESGEVKAVFTLGDRVGEQEKSINVLTDDGWVRPVALILHVLIPELLTCSPRLLLWNIGEALSEKAAVVAANSKLRITDITVPLPAPAGVAVKITPVEAGVSYQLFVRPQSSATTMNVTITGVATFTDGSTQPFKVYALVR